MTRYRRDKGFTLIEILVVVAIVAIVTAVATLSLSLVGEDRDSRTEARRLASLLEVALDESILQGREFGIELMTGGYRFVEYDPQTLTWVELPFDETLRPRDLPEGVTMELFVEDQRVVLEEQAAELDDPDEDEADDDRNFAPHVLVFSSGDVTPFEVHLSRSQMEDSVVLSVDALGQAEISAGEEL
jgi:general secretion pathway protein H